MGKKYKTFYQSNIKMGYYNHCGKYIEDTKLKKQTKNSTNQPTKNSSNQPTKQSSNQPTKQSSDYDKLNKYTNINNKNISEKSTLHTSNSDFFCNKYEEQMLGYNMNKNNLTKSIV